MTRLPRKPKSASHATRERRSESYQRPRVSGRSGASQSKSRWTDRFHSYLLHHLTTALESLQRLLKTPFQSLLTWLVVAVALVLPALLYVGLINVKILGAGWEGSPKISVFLHQRATSSAIEKLEEKLLAKPVVESAVYVSPEQALEEFQSYSGFGSVLQILNHNPLPGTLLLQIPAQADASSVSSLKQELLSSAIVDDVRVDMDWIQRLQHILALAQRVVIALGCLLSLGALLAVGNTVRLAIESRREEIVIVKLVGATNAFVRRPFLYTGWWYGLGGGVVSLLLLFLGMAGLKGPVAQLADLYHSDFRLQGLGLSGYALLLVCSGLLGLCGAWIAVNRHLNSIEPS